MPPSIIDEFGILRKGSKAQLMKKLAIESTEPFNPDYVIVDAGQLLYHIVWPSDGTVSTRPRLRFTATAMYHERERCAIGVCAGTYNLTLTSPLPNREVTMKSKANKILLSRLLCTCTLAPNIVMVGED